MSDKIEKPSKGIVRKSSGLSALRGQISGAEAAAIPADESLVLVLDVSPSMGEPTIRPTIYNPYPPPSPTKIEVLREAALTLVTRCAQGRSQIGLVEFGGFARVHEVISLDLVKLGKSVGTIAGGRTGLDSYWSGFIGGTNLVGGLHTAWGLLAPTNTRIKRIVLMTDGGDNSLVGGMEPTLAQLPTMQQTLKEGNCIVDCVAFGDDADKELLARIAGTTGVVKNANNAEELVKAFAQLEAGARGLLTKGS